MCPGCFVGSMFVLYVALILVMSVVVGFERGHLFSCVCEHMSFVFPLQRLKILSLSRQSLPLENHVFVLWKFFSLVISCMKGKHCTVSMCVKCIFILPGNSSLQFPAFSATFSMRLDVEGHTPCLELYHFVTSPTIRSFYFLHETSKAKDCFGLQYFEAQLFLFRRKTSTSTFWNHVNICANISNLLLWTRHLNYS